MIGFDEVYGKREIEGRIEYALMPKDVFLHHVSGRFVDGRLLARTADTRFPDPFEPETNRRSFTELSPEFNAYHILNWLVYLASNSLVWPSRSLDMSHKWRVLLDMLVQQLSRRIVTTVFSSNSLSIRATWENVVSVGARIRHNDAAVFLIETALD